MVLAAPGPLLTPPPSSSPPKTPHRSYSAQTRSQDEEKNPSPKPYLPPQTRTRHRRAHRPHVPTLMRGNTPPTTRSPPHLSRRTGNPPNLQRVTVSEEERGGRDPTSRRTPMRAAPDCRPPPTARHASQQQHQPPPPATRRSPQGAASRHGEGGQSLRRTAALRRTSGCGPRPGPPPPPQSAPPTQPLTTRSLPTTTGRRKGGHPVVSNRPLHRAMQQRCHHASASARSPSWPPMPRPRLQRAATARREKVQLRIREQSFSLVSDPLMMQTVSYGTYLPKGIYGT